MLTALLFTTIAVTVANTIGNLFPRISNSYFEMAMGILIASIPALNHIVPAFNFEIFMLTVAPLLFFEGQVTAATAVTHHLQTIFSVAGLLVLLTTLLVGGLLNLVTGVTLSVGLVLAVVSAPTDATALEAVSGGVQIPDNETELLKLEGLFNDASGLVLLQIAILFLHGHQIKLSSSIGSFVQAAGGGIIFGLLLGVLVIAIRHLLLRMTVHLSVPVTMVYLLSPFVIFLGAEALHFSGILAVVTAGILGNGEIKHIRFVNPRQTRWSIDLMDLLTELLNGAAFLSLGLLVTRIIEGNLNILINSFRWLFLGTLLYFGSTLVRYLYIKLTTNRTWQTALIFAFGGVHGAVNLALALSLLEYNLARSTFELIVMAEAVFILLSMLVPTLVFKLILPATPAPQLMAQQLTKLKQAMVAEALKQVDSLTLDEKVKHRVRLDIRSQARQPQFLDFIDRRTSTSNLSTQDQQQRQQALRTIFESERHYLRAQEKQSPDQALLANQLFNEVLLAESAALDLTGD